MFIKTIMSLYITWFSSVSREQISIKIVKLNSEKQGGNLGGHVEKNY